MRHWVCIYLVLLGLFAASASTFSCPNADVSFGLEPDTYICPTHATGGYEYQWLQPKSGAKPGCIGMHHSLFKKTALQAGRYLPVFMAPKPLKGASRPNSPPPSPHISTPSPSPFLCWSRVYPLAVSSPIVYRHSTPFSVLDTPAALPGVVSSVASGGSRVTIENPFASPVPPPSVSTPSVPHGVCSPSAVRSPLAQSALSPSSPAPPADVPRPIVSHPVASMRVCIESSTKASYSWVPPPVSLPGGYPEALSLSLEGTAVHVGARVDIPIMGVRTARVVSLTLLNGTVLSEDVNAPNCALPTLSTHTRSDPKADSANWVVMKSGNVAPPLCIVTRNTRVSIDLPSVPKPSPPAPVPVGGLSPAQSALLSNVTAHLDTNRPREYCPPTLLVGPSGTGKSTFASHCASTAGVPLLTFNCALLVSSEVGGTGRSILSAFKHAAKMAPCVMVLERVDALCPQEQGREAQEGEAAARSALLQCLTDTYSSTPTGSGTSSTSSTSSVSSPSFPRVALFATLVQLGDVHPGLRGTGFPRDVFFSPPDTAQRADILSALLGLDTHSTERGDVVRACHGLNGYLQADLVQAAALFTRHRSSAEGGVGVEAGLRHALLRVRPSGTRELAVSADKVEWDDIAGHAELKRLVRQALPEDTGSGLTRGSSGILLYGPPGCGKTMLAKALATHGKCTFMAVGCRDVLSMYVGESERRVREIFARARSVAPCIVFLDEVEALAPARGGSKDKVMTRVVATLLAQLDECAPNGVFVAAATNRPDLIDKGILRPGRIDYCVYVAPPDLPARQALLSKVGSRMPLSPDVDLSSYASETEGYSGAELAAVCRRAGMLALGEYLAAERDAKTNGIETVSLPPKVVTPAHFQQALIDVKPRIDAETLAFHQHFRR
ncbi:hypothetical protein KIPB_003139 [Kipferlia bialata]|uniref:AAA+ ATPase domain-containing protein n=1 Tax=Kipferlia bialata TaxID=797122 RepID=A0A9K3GFK5_9EUKA|nr:hypothetical protein KIPB_003139 [Kipferlia bialata]|eukprot:g3139.t1